MKLVLKSVCEGVYNRHQLHAFIEVQEAPEVTKLEEFKYRTYLNEQVLPILKANFKAQSHTIHEFLYDSQGAPISLLISSNSSSNNTGTLLKHLDTCIKSSNQFFNPKKGFFAIPLVKEEEFDVDMDFSAAMGK